MIVSFFLGRGGCLYWYDVGICVVHWLLLSVCSFMLSHAAGVWCDVVPEAFFRNVVLKFYTLTSSCIEIIQCFDSQLE